MEVLNNCPNCNNIVHLNQDFCPYCGYYQKPSNRNAYLCGLNLDTGLDVFMTYEDKEHIKKQKTYLERGLARMYSNYNGYSHEAYYEAWENLQNIRESNWVLFLKAINSNNREIIDKLLLKDYGNPSANIVEMANYLQYGKKSLKEKRDDSICVAIDEPSLRNSGEALKYSLGELGKSIWDFIVYNNNKKFLKLPNHLLVEENQGGFNNMWETDRKIIPKCYYENNKKNTEFVKCPTCGRECDTLYNVCSDCGTNLRTGELHDTLMNGQISRFDFKRGKTVKADLEIIKIVCKDAIEKMGNEFYSCGQYVDKDLNSFKWQDIIYDLDEYHNCGEMIIEKIILK